MEVRHIGLMVDPISGYGSKILDGISRFAHQRPGWRITYFDRERRELGRLVAEWKGNGIICTVVDDTFLEAALGRDIPVINVGGRITDESLVNVISDDHAVGRMAGDFLLGRGFENFAFVRRQQITRFANERGAGFRERLAEVGCKMIELRVKTRGEDELAGQIAELPRPLAVLGSTDALGAAVVEACWQLGLRIPEEIAVLGIGNHKQLCELCSPTLSSVEVDMERRGYEAAALLDRILQGDPQPSGPVQIQPAHVDERRSTDIYAFDDADVVEALRFIRNGAPRSIKVGDVVAATGLSRRTLEGRFNDLVGRTIHEEIWRAHFDLAQRLLASSDLGLQEVAGQSGFRTASALVNLFRQRLEMTPREYRVANRR